jgi:predicted Rossmann fold flavoprotein
MGSEPIVVVGGGAAGIYAAIACAEANPRSDVTVLEKGAEFLSKVRISGGGRCNVTHACFDPQELSARYPRGGRELVGPFTRFQPRDTISWFEGRGVRLRVESDGRIFPASNSARTIVECLLRAAGDARVRLESNSGVEHVARCTSGGFELQLSDNRILRCNRLLLATGGCRTAAAGRLAAALGHTLSDPVPSLFAFRLEARWLKKLTGISMASVEASVPAEGLRERGALLVTHGGVSGPVILGLSAWGARILHARNYRFLMRINWLPHLEPNALKEEFRSLRGKHAAKRVVNTPIPPLPARLWEKLVLTSGVRAETRWSALSRSALRGVIQQLTCSDLAVSGKSLNRDEFVTCGGVRLDEVDFKTMESRICPGLHLAGELLDVDGLTGGFNFQAAWTTARLAGQAMAGL